MTPFEYDKYLQQSGKNKYRMRRETEPSSISPIDVLLGPTIIAANVSCELFIFINYIYIILNELRKKSTKIESMMLFLKIVLELKNCH